MYYSIKRQRFVINHTRKIYLKISVKETPKVHIVREGLFWIPRKGLAINNITQCQVTNAVSF